MKEKTVKKSILFLPFLQIPSGHHQVAKALMEGIQQNRPDIQCEKLDILSFSYGKIESMVSNTYIKWIHAFPALYSLIYRNSVYKNLEENKRYRLYEFLFLPFMRRLLKEKQPDLIICTHALPSYMLNHLKEKEGLTIPVINAYTDYFIHRFWGVQNIDYHFVTSLQMKEYLKQKGIHDDRIFITGIPIHHKISKLNKPGNWLERAIPLNILITGGNLGAGTIEELVNKIKKDSTIHFYVLCGTNERLYSNLKSLDKNNVTPLKYIESKEEINDLYDQMDAIITKPGGVTISECLSKRKPILIYHALPGQEEINLETLEQLGVIFHLKQWKDDEFSLNDWLASFFQDSVRLDDYQSRISTYHQQLTTEAPSKIVLDLLESKKERT
ncbi:glycosyltransferase [Bacillus sp. CECT 9360]|uniref:MGDG synthase family glycosyltransferase n=1 Tax=Bacillus sp. CECT 9360 TaxID=2845821 RepID=UPI001E5C6910|nr:glycosyltransferase [Bacillus sp. CECT 9360]CAH0347462.1 Processive diacylglycerol beta-glucosyltransferase [Bacillus sp. CECT 9360]